MVRALDLLSGGLELKSLSLPLDRFVGTFNKFLFNLWQYLTVRVVIILKKSGTNDLSDVAIFVLFS